MKPASTEPAFVHQPAFVQPVSDPASPGATPKFQATCASASWLGPELQPTTINADAGQQMANSAAVNPSEDLPNWLTKLTPMNRQALRLNMGEEWWAVTLQYSEPPPWLIFEDMGDWQQKQGGLGISLDEWKEYLQGP